MAKLRTSEVITNKRTVTETIKKTTTKIVDVPMSEVWDSIVKEIGGRNIVRFSMSCAFDSYPENVNKNIFYTELNTIRMIKKHTAMCFCKSNEYVIMQTRIKDIENIFLKKQGKRNRIESYDLYFNEKTTGLYWSCQLDISCREY